ncbi:glycosyltransferase family 4 protein [Patescibacteria group bacterium]|nr:glycosyltransferase family 4 protein [Patescibacteria group bacterium]MBU0845665.1 glycosyltransferase family 4 protein [Patescibacteria group bacterium]MBU0923231.1 glycosyltransferase family 4 protein [Patescibacteria group bacterium]
MKILIDARLYGLENAGLGRYLVNLIDELANIDKKNRYVLLLRKKYFKELSVPENWEKVLVDFRHYSFIEQIRLPRIISKHKPSITHFPHFNVPVFFKGKYIVTIHDILMHKQKGRNTTTLSAPLYYLKKIGYHRVFRKAVCGSEKIIVPSNFVKKELIDYYGLEKSKITVTYEGVDTNIVSKGKKENIFKKYNISSPYFIYAGNAYPHKNLKRVVEAMVLLNEEVDKKVLFVMTSARNVFTKKLRETIKKAKADKYIKLLGFVPDHDLGVLFKHSTAFIFPSLSEGFGLPGMEAIRAGTLVLASDIPVFKEVYKDSVSYFNPFDFSSMTKAMKNTMAMSIKEREKRIAINQNYIKRYSWATMAKQTLKVYENSVSV